MEIHATRFDGGGHRFADLAVLMEAISILRIEPQSCRTLFAISDEIKSASPIPAKRDFITK